jgi:molybdopterin-guanine dinucleotide biosynthesis protein A
VTEVSACILAGGRATRLGGRAKPLVPVRGTPILERQLDVLAPRVAEVIVALAPDAAPLPVPDRWADRVRFVHDEASGAGPLAGIAAGLAACRTPWLLVVAGDLPHLHPGIIDLLIRTATTVRDTDAVVVRRGVHPEPLCGVHRTSQLTGARTLIREGRYKAAGLLEGLRVHWIDEAKLREIDPELRTLDDIDTPDDLVRSQTD